jgi:hypothetical protein
MNATDLSSLNGKVVLVSSAVDKRNPPTGRRGTLFVDADERGEPVVSVEIEFPEMFTSRAHRRRIVLDHEQIEQLMQTDHYATYSLCLPGRLDPALSPGNE